MARAGITRAKMPILRDANKQISRGLSKLAEALDDQLFTVSLKGDKINSKEGLAAWLPHPRSGIYFPEGQKHVMDDVPDGETSFDRRTFWLRSHDGVEKPDLGYFSF